jgi:hypothetical protein
MDQTVEMTRDKLRTLRLSAEEDEAFERVARSRRVSVSELMRLLVKEASERLSTAPDPDELFERATRLWAKEERRMGTDREDIAGVFSTLSRSLSGFNARGVYELRAHVTKEYPKGRLWGRYDYDLETDVMKAATEKAR